MPVPCGILLPPPPWQLCKVFFLVAQGKAEGAGPDYLGVGSMILEAGAYVLEGDLSPLGKVFFRQWTEPMSLGGDLCSWAQGLNS